MRVQSARFCRVTQLSCTGSVRMLGAEATTRALLGIQQCLQGALCYRKTPTACCHLDKQETPQENMWHLWTHCHFCVSTSHARHSDMWPTQPSAPVPTHESGQARSGIPYSSMRLQHTSSAVLEHATNLLQYTICIWGEGCKCHSAWSCCSTRRCLHYSAISACKASNSSSSGVLAGAAVALPAGTLGSTAAGALPASGRAPKGTWLMGGMRGTMMLNTLHLLCKPLLSWLNELSHFQVKVEGCW